MKSTDKHHNRLLELDAFRGIAALCVVLFHFTTRYRQLYGYQFTSKFDFNYGHYGVEFFFVISGFVIFMTLQNVRSTLDFAFKRFSRLYPSYWICLILTATSIAVFGLPGRSITFKQVLVNFTMIQEIFNVKNVEGAYWTLLPELLFYGLMGIVFQFALIKHIKIIGLIWMIFICCFTKFVHFNPIYILLNLRYGMFFFAGIIFYDIKFNRLNSKRSYLDHLYILICALLGVLADPVIQNIIAIAIIFSCFYLFAYNRIALIKTSVFLFLGYVSYPLYLIHEFIGYIIIRKLVFIGMSEILSIVIAIVFTIVIAFMITFFLEKPILKFLRTIGNTKKHVIVTSNNEGSL